MPTINELYEKAGISKKLYIYVDDATEPIPDEYIRQGSSQLHRSICSQTNLRFGGCESSYIKLRLSNAFGKLKGKKFRVEQSIDENIVKLGQFYVDSDVPSTDKKYRDLVAYDILSTAKNIDMSDWYSRLIFPMKLKKFRDLFFPQIGLTQVETTLPNDDIIVEQNPTTSGVLASAIMWDICAINGAFGRINEDGLFDYVFLSKDKASAYEVTTDLQKKLSYEDYITHDITVIKFTQTTMDADFYYGKGDNQYPLSLTVLNVGDNTDTLDLVCANVYDKIAGVVFQPIDISTRGNFNLPVGQYIKTYGYEDEEIYTYCLQQDFVIDSEEQITGTYRADGTQTYTRETNTNSEAIYDIDKEIQTIYRNNFYAYTFTNEEKISVSQVEKVVIKFDISATAKTDVVFIGTIPLVMDLDGKVTVDYYIDATKREEDSVPVVLPKGNQVITVTNFLPMSEDGRLTLTVSIKVEYFETENRVQDAKIISLENYVKNGTYTDPVIDQTVAKTEIPLHGIKAVVFAKGLAGEVPWDGTLNLTDSLSLFTVTKKDVGLLAFGESVSVVPIENIFTNIKETLSLLPVENTQVKMGIIDALFIKGVTHWYIINMDNKETCTYSTEFIDDSEKFKLRTNYMFNGVTEIIDSGYIKYVQFNTTDYVSITSVEFVNSYENPKYLVYDVTNTKYYNIIDNKLNEITIDTLNSEAFTMYGNDTPPNLDIIMNIDKFRLYSWSSEDVEFEFSTNMQAIPKAQDIITSGVDLTGEGITGIENVEITNEGNPLFAVSFDNEASWSMMTDTGWAVISEEHNGMTTEVFQNITTQQWSEQLVNVEFIKIRISLFNTGDSLTQIKVNYTN